MVWRRSLSLVYFTFRLILPVGTTEILHWRMLGHARSSNSTEISYETPVKIGKTSGALELLPTSGAPSLGHSTYLSWVHLATVRREDDGDVTESTVNDAGTERLVLLIHEEDPE